MTTQCDPAKLRIIETDGIEHFHLPQCHISSLPAGKPSKHLDQYVVSINVAESAEFIKSKFVRLSAVLIPGFEGSRLKVLRKLCEAAHPSEEFFTTIARNQWLRTTISGRNSVDLFTLTEAKRRRCIVIHSNVLPYDSYWRRPQLAVGDESSREHFPCHILKEADDQRQPLRRKLIEWRQENVGREECAITKHEEGDIRQQQDENIPQRGPSKKFWEVRDKVLTAKVTINEQISQVTWRGGTFIKKYTKNQVEFDAEVNAMEKLCHPHIIYIFGINSYDGKQGSLYMECMESDLLALILELLVRPDGGDKGPPFSHYNSVDILLQIAKAMAHMHQNGVIHGDLKTPNILVSKFEISRNQRRYLAKVADFGSSQMKVSRGFRPAGGTTYYAAPEVLKFRLNSDMVIPVRPEYIDVYSYGLVAFEVLTGLTMEHIYKNRTPTEVKEGVMNGTLKPPLRAECGKEKFLCNGSLMALIERCWDIGTSERPPQRPLFPEIVEVLKAVREQIPEGAPAEMLQQEDAPEVLQQQEGTTEVLQQEGEPEVLQQEDAPEVLQQEGEPEVLQQEDAPEVLQQEDAPEVLQQEGEPEVMQQQEGTTEVMQQQEGTTEVLQQEGEPEVMQQEGTTEVLQQEGEPEVMQQEGAPEALQLAAAPRAVHLEPVPRALQLEAGAAPKFQEANPLQRRKRRGKTLKKLLRPFSRLSCMSGGNVQD